MHTRDAMKTEVEMESLKKNSNNNSDNDSSSQSPPPSPWIGPIVFLCVVLIVMLSSHRTHNHNNPSEYNKDDDFDPTSSPSNSFAIVNDELVRTPSSPANKPKKQDQAAPTSSFPPPKKEVTTASPKKQKKKQSNNNNNNNNEILAAPWQNPAAKAFDTSSSSSSGAAADVVSPRFVIASVSRGGGIGSMYAAVSRLCYTETIKGAHAVQYSMDDVVKFVPEEPRIQHHGGYKDVGQFREKWAKLFLIKRTFKELALREDDWVIWMEPDVFVTNPFVTLQNLIFNAKSKSSSASTSGASHNLVIGSDPVNGVNTRVFAIRASDWSRKFLDLWYRDQNAVLYGYDVGPFMHALLRVFTSSSKSYNDECKTNAKRVEHLPEKGNKDFWNQKSFQTEFVKCFKDYVEKHILPAAGGGEGSKFNVCKLASASSDDGESTKTIDVTGVLPTQDPNVAAQCAFSGVRVLRNNWNEKDSDDWIHEGKYEDFSKFSLALSRRFSPRCF